MQTPDEVYGALFADVQLQRVFPDNKTFVDSIPKRKPAAIVADYLQLRNHELSNAGIKKFVEENFDLPPEAAPGYHTDIRDNVIDHIEELWHVLKRNADKPVEGSSLIALPFSYIVPGGRFREIYYWDSYFTMLGLAESGHWNIIENMVENFAFLVEQYGHIPNGNRTYFLSRSQPPFFSSMIELLASHKNNSVYAVHQSALQKEYDYWMDESDETQHVVKMPDGSFLNRYYDMADGPRQESYREDSKLSDEQKGDVTLLYRNLRAACESGWDFSSRWFADGENFYTIDTTNIIPVDLNCLLFHLETSLALSYRQTENIIYADLYAKKASMRRDAINKYFYNQDDGWYYDFNISKKSLNDQKTLAGIIPFFFNVAPAAYITKAAAIIRNEFLQPGGVVTTLKETEQQWDWPNGWAPLQWMAIRGLDNYGEKELATEIARRWAQLNIKVYRNTGKLMEKYNVVDTNITAGGGEYPSQDGFGWNNGVLLKILKSYEIK